MNRFLRLASQLILLAGVLWMAGCNFPRPTASPPPTVDITAAYATLNAATTPEVPAASPTTPATLPAGSLLTPTVSVTEPPATQGPPCNMAAAARPVDITIPDGTVLRPGQPFTKIWRLINAGSCPWGPDYAVVWFSGARLGAPAVVPLGTTVQPGQAVDIAVDMLAPLTPGTYTSYWKLRDANGALFGIGPGVGSPFWVSIVVQVEGTATPTDTPTPTLTPTRTPTFTPTPTPVVYAEGTLALSPDDQVDLDGMVLTNTGADLGYTVSPEGAHQIAPLHEARLGVYGLTPPSPQDCAAAAKAQVSIPLEPLSPGIYFCVQTDQGRLGRMRFQGLEGDTLHLEAVTWAAGE